MLEVIKDEALHLPVAVVREWQNHSQVGPDFQAFLDKFVEMGYKLIDPEEEAKKKREEEDRKRGAGEGGGGPQPSPKRARVAEALDSSFIIPGAEISSPLIQEIKLGANWPTVHCRGENTFYLVNGTEKPFSQVDACIAFFGSGSYKIIKDNQDMPTQSCDLQPGKQQGHGGFEWCYVFIVRCGFITAAAKARLQVALLWHDACWRWCIPIHL